MGFRAVSAALASMWPVMLGNLYNGISDGAIKTITQGLSAVIVFGLIYLSAECIAIVRRVMIDCVIASHESDIRTRSIEKMLKMPVAYFSGGLKGERTAQLNQGVAGLSQLIKIVCNDIFATVLTAVCTMAQAFLNAPPVMTGIMLAYLVVTVLISVFQIRSQNGIRENIVAQKNALDGQICQSIGNLQFIRSVSAENYETKRLSPIIKKIGFTEKRHHRYMGTFDCLKQLCKVLFQVIIIVVSILLAANGAMPAGVAITVCLLFQQLIKPIDEVYRFMDETASSAIKAKTLVEVHSGASDEVYDIKSSDKCADNSGIHLRDVVVVNPEKTKRIAWYENVFFPSGQITALRGANGSGKTSLVLALNRYYSIEKGCIEMFGKPQKDYSQKELTETLFYSPQVSFFVEGTVRDTQGNPLPGTTIRVRETKGGSMADEEGRFTLSVPRGKAVTVDFTFVGMKTVTLPINKTTYEIKMENATSLQEVTVVSKRRARGNSLPIPERELSTATQSLSMKDFEGLGITSVDEILQGTVAGLDVIGNSGDLGSGSTMRLRGATSLSTLTNSNQADVKSTFLCHL